MKKFMKGSIPVMGMLLIATILIASCQKEQVNENNTSDIAALSAEAMSSAAAKGTMTIGEIAAADGRFTQLVDALDYTGLLNIFLTGTDQYTVFAPTDAAFQALYTSLNITSIRALDVSFVTNVLMYHVTEGRRASNSVLPKKNYKTIATLLDKPFYVNSTGGIDTNDAGNNPDALITTPDISASNGIIHIINAVLIPE